MSERFLWMTKGQAFVLVVVLFVASIALNVFDTVRLSDLADRGARTQVAVCIYRDQLVQNEASNKAYLKMSIPERTQKFGAALAHIPDAVINKSIAQEETAIKALGHAGCG